MRFTGVFLTLGWGGIMIAFLMFFPALWALLSGSIIEAKKFFLDALIITFVSGAFIFSSRDVRKHKVRKTELFLTSTLVFFILPVFAALPLIGTGYQIGFWQAYFEAVSGLTTTGASIYTHPEFETEATLLWRALIGWVGGLLTLTVCVSLFVPANMPGVGVKGALQIKQNENDSLHQRFRRSMKLIYRPYAGLTLIGFLALWFSGAGFFDALCFTLNTISTTGFTPQLGALTDYMPPFSLFVITLLMLVGALSFPLQSDVFRGRLQRLFADVEFVHFIIFIIFFTFLYFIFSTASHITSLSGAFMMAVSLVTTTALPMVETSSDPTIGPSVLVLFFPIIIGGMLLSTTGGIKVLRVVIMLKYIWAEMKILPYPSAVEHLTYGTRRVEESDVAKIWFFTILAILSFGLVFVMSGLFYTDFNTTWLGAVALITNTGGVAVISGHPDLYANLSSFGHIFSSIVMVFGRLELMALLVLFNPAYWRSGN